MEPSKEEQLDTPPRWDLSFLYSGIDDPQLELDLEDYERRAADFSATHRGHLAATLGAALRDYVSIIALENKIDFFVYEVLSSDVGNESAKAKDADLSRRRSTVNAEHLTFFDLEVAALDQEQIDRQAAEDNFVSHHLPFLAAIRRRKPHHLTAEKEEMLALCEPLMLKPWEDYYRQVMGEMKIPWEGSELSFETVLSQASNDPSPERRASGYRAVHEAMSGSFAMLSANTLNETVAAKAMQDRARHRPHPMHSRNMGNMLSDRSVEALHEAVATKGAELCQRFYRLKAALLGLDKLKWSDRNAPMPFKDTSKLPWSQTVAVCRQAYREFSPTMGDIVDEMLVLNRVDAAPGGNRRSGAHCNGTVLPDGRVVSVTFQTFHGLGRNLTTVAHELGHGCHFYLAGQAQGLLQSNAPMALAETASIFGEGLVFGYQLEQAQRDGDDAALSLIMTKLDATMNTIVRQVGFSFFERAVHGHDGATLTRRPVKQWSVPELCNLWMDSIKMLYGEEGEVFTYEDTAYLWAYVHHFHSPFYCHCYSAANMFVESIIAARARLGTAFEPMFLEILRAGNTKMPEDLLAPVGLNPEDREFWESGLEYSIARRLRLAEELAAKRGIVIK